MKTIYVGNLNYQATEKELRELFEPLYRGTSRELNGSRLGNRTLVVSKSRPRVARAETPRGTGERRSGRG